MKVHGEPWRRRQSLGPGKVGPWGFESCMPSWCVRAVSADRKGCAGGKRGREVEPLPLCGAPGLSVTGRNAQRIKRIVAFCCSINRLQSFISSFPLPLFVCAHPAAVGEPTRMPIIILVRGCCCPFWGLTPVPACPPPRCHMELH